MASGRSPPARVAVHSPADTGLRSHGEIEVLSRRSGLGRLPSRSFGINAAWLTATMIAVATARRTCAASRRARAWAVSGSPASCTTPGHAAQPLEHRCLMPHSPLRLGPAAPCGSPSPGRNSRVTRVRSPRWTTSARTGGSPPGGTRPALTGTPACAHRNRCALCNGGFADRPRWNQPVRHVALIQALLPLLRPRGIARRIPSPGSPPRRRRRCAISLTSACPGPR
jgi:hypothetical protein